MIDCPSQHTLRQFRLAARFIPLALLTLALLVGCGGGSGSGGSGTSSSQTYTGLTTSASVTLANADELATNSYSNGNSVTSIGDVLSAPGQPGAVHDAGPNSVTITDWAQAQIRSALAREPHHLDARNLHSSNRSNPAKETRSTSGSLTGDCGGSAAYAITADSVTRNFSGSFTFSGYCNEAVTITGSFSFSGTLDVDDSFATTSLALSELTLVTSDRSLTVDGTVTTTASGATVTITSNLVLRDNTTSTSYKTENLVVTLVAATSSASVTLAGRVYHPSEGYVTLSTPVPLVVETGDQYPSSGTFVATGANNGTVTVTALTNTTYQLEIDVNGDGTPESSSTEVWGD